MGCIDHDCFLKSPCPIVMMDPLHTVQRNATQRNLPLLPETFPSLEAFPWQLSQLWQLVGLATGSSSDARSPQVSSTSRVELISLCVSYILYDDTLPLLVITV